MPELFIELFSEEIPARMQKRAEEDLLKLMREKLEARGLEFKDARTFSAPRRLGVSITDLPAKAADVNEEKKGPRVGAPDQAIQGFLKSAGLTSIDQAQVVEDKKGAFYVARIERAGAATPAIVQEVLPEIIRAFPWPKSMRSGDSDLQWVRPLHNICCVFDGRRSEDRRRRRSERSGDMGPSLPCAGEDRGRRHSMAMPPICAAPKCCRSARSARAIILRAAKELVRRRTGWSWLKIRVCLKRSRGWPNGRK